MPEKAKGRRRKPGKVVSRKRPKTPFRLTAVVDENKQFLQPTLVFKRRYPSLTFPVPPIGIPMYWFTRQMVDKGIITRVTDDVFICDGRRFKVVGQGWKEIGSFGFTRWLVYEEAAGKGII